MSAKVENYTLGVISKNQAVFLFRSMYLHSSLEFSKCMKGEPVLGLCNPRTGYLLDSTSKETFPGTCRGMWLQPAGLE